jgi:hypothetical protein
MRIRDTLLALTATVVAGSALAAVATPAAAQDYYRGYAPVYQHYGYERPRFEHRWGYAAPVYGYGYYGYGYHRHYDAYRPYWR